MKKKNVWETARKALSERGMSWDNSDEADPIGRPGQAPAAPGPGRKSWADPRMKGVPWKGDQPGLKGLPPERSADVDVDMSDLGGDAWDDMQKSYREAAPTAPRRRSDTMPLPTGYHRELPAVPDQGLTNPADKRFQNAPEYDAMPTRRRQSATTRQIPVRREGTPSPRERGLAPKYGKDKHHLGARDHAMDVGKNDPFQNHIHTDAGNIGKEMDDDAHRWRHHRPKTEASGCASGAGHQAPIIGDAAEAARDVYREALDAVFLETVRKLPNGKYGVYVKNTGKKKAPVKKGEFTTRVAAQEKEVAIGGKTGESAKKAKERISKLKKDPKKMAAANAKDRKKKSSKKESIIKSMVAGLNEALFREDDIPGSTWDERLAGISPTALASNKKLAGHTKSIQKASVSSLMDAHKLLSKALKKHGKLNHGDIGTETGGKMYLPCKLGLDEDGGGGGTIHLYIDGGNVKMEMDDDMNETIDGMEDEGHGLRGAIMAFSQKHLPKIDGAKIAYMNRDKDLDKWEKDHDDELSGRDGVSLHLLKHLIGAKHGRRYR